MEKRVEAATLFERTMRNESQERVDDIENPRERAGRYFDMENVNAEISRERARAESTRTNESSQTREAVHSIPSSEDKSR